MWRAALSIRQGLLGSDWRASPNRVRREPAVMMNWRQQAKRVHGEAQVFYFAFKHPRVPWYAKLVAACTAGYLFSPVQLIPSFIPVVGFLDDFLVFFLGVKLLRRIIPPEVLTECRELVEAAHMQRDEEVRSAAGIVVLCVVVVLWFLAAVTASAMMWTYIPH